MQLFLKAVIPAWTTAKDGGSAAGEQEELAPLAGIQAPWMASSLPSMALDTRSCALCGYPGAGMTHFAVRPELAPQALPLVVEGLVQSFLN